MSQAYTGIILKNNTIFEKDKLVTLFSKEKGLIRVLAKFAAASKKRFAGRLQPFNEIEFHLSTNKGLKQIQNCNILNHYSEIYNTYNSLCLAGYMAQITCKIASENQINETLFTVLKQHLTQININKPDLEKIKESFEIHLLHSEGLLDLSSNNLSANKRIEVLQQYCGSKITQPQWLNH